MPILLRALIFGLLCIILFGKANPLFAATTSYKITDGFSVDPPGASGVGVVYFFKNLQINYETGVMLLSSTPDGTGSAKIGDLVQVINGYPVNQVFTYPAALKDLCKSPQVTIPPTDITHVFVQGVNNVLVRLSEWCGGVEHISPLYLVNTDPIPTPFLDLPWDYGGDGLTFSEAALNINSFFDHEYPLLSSGFSETASVSDTIINFQESNRVDRAYSSHDGYDYGTQAGVENGDSVLAAASGSATFVNSCGACGNAIHIDHGNGYQTRYYHLQRGGLITSTPGETVAVNAGDVIGRVGFTGTVRPKSEDGAHIHFMVIQDRDEDGDFEDNIPDGMTDPFGWQSTEADPWEGYAFFQNDIEKTGNKSYYLWSNRIDNLRADLPANGGVFSTGRFTVTFPEGATSQVLKLEMLAAPLQRVTEILRSVGATMQIIAKDPLGNLVTIFTKPFTVGIDFGQADLSKFKLGTISIYSSTDGETWVKEESFVDFLNKHATAEVDHLTYFALMGERVDTIAPTTTPVFFGEQGEEHWYRSDVTLSLDAVDNEGGLGVAYTLYRVDQGDWEEYSIPLQFTDEGIHTVEFYSVDRDENIEELKSVEIHIDKTAPVVFVNANPKTLWPPNGTMVDVTVVGNSADDHLLSTGVFVEDEYDEVEPIDAYFGQVIQLEAKRQGKDKDGRLYVVRAVAKDKAGNTSEAEASVVVPHDHGDRSD